MRIILVFFSILFFVFFDPLNTNYTGIQKSYILLVFLASAIFVDPRLGSKILHFKPRWFFVMYVSYLLISNKIELLKHVTDIRTYLIDKQLLLNYNTSLLQTFVAYYQQLVIVSGVVIFLNNERWRYLGLGIILFEVLTTGTRSYGIFIIVSLLTYYTHKFKWKLKHYFLTAVLLLGMFYVSEVYSHTRSGYELATIELASSAISFSKETVMAFKIESGITEFEDPFLYMLSSLIPRALWKEKPMSKIVEWYTLEFWGFSSDENQGTVLPGLVGQLFLGARWFGILELFAFLFVCHSLIRFCQYDLSVQTLFFSGLILSLRMIALANFLPFIISIFLCQWQLLKRK